MIYASITVLYDTWFFEVFLRDYFIIILNMCQSITIASLINYCFDPFETKREDHSQGLLGQILGVCVVI